LLSARREHPERFKSILSLMLLTGVALLCFPLVLQAAPSPTDFSSPSRKNLESQARAAHKAGNWLLAVRCYDELIHGKEKPSAEVREAYQECLRRYSLQRRHGDRLYHDSLGKLEQRDALAILDQVLETLSKSYFDPHKTDPGALFRNGLQEIAYALDDEAFTKQYLPTADKKVLDALRVRLEELKAQRVTNSQQCRDAIVPFARYAHQQGAVANVQRAAVLFALEFACGACNSLDEYTLYLTPFHLNALRGRYVGVGVDLAITDQKVVISRVYPNSPAEDAKLAAGDRVQQIDSQDVDGMAPDAVAERLLGEPDTIIELDVLSDNPMNPGEPIKSHIRLVRRAVATPTVEHRMAGTMGSGLEDVGYLRIHSFQETTPKEVQEALAQLQTAGIKGLILDLRGNPGGLFKAAVQVSDLFLGENSIIVFTQGQLKEFNKPYKAEGGNPFQAPVVVLVDGDTASSAEILAAALKENGKAKLFGQTTFGKGTIQQIIPLNHAGGGIRVTVARFSSPLKTLVAGSGVVPNVTVVETESDATYSRALNELLLLLGKMPMSMSPMMSGQ